jgi:hypothetical protein
MLKKCNTTGWDPFEAGKSFQRRQAEAEKEAIWQRCIEIAESEMLDDCIDETDGSYNVAISHVIVAIRAEKEKP